MTETPLKWTSRGNVPLESLNEKREWQKQGRVLMIHRVWTDKVTGELLANDIDAYVLPMSLWQRIKMMFSDVSVSLKGAQAKAEGSL